MKRKKMIARLERRQKAHDDEVAKDYKLARSRKRPGSLKKA